MITDSSPAHPLPSLPVEEALAGEQHLIPTNPPGPLVTQFPVLRSEVVLGMLGLSCLDSRFAHEKEARGSGRFLEWGSTWDTKYPGKAGYSSAYNESVTPVLL